MGAFDSFLNFFLKWGPSLLLGVGYIMVLLCVRRMWIFRRNTAHLHAYAEMVEVRLMTEQNRPESEDPLEKALIPKIRELIEEARKQVPLDTGGFSWRSCFSLEGADKQLAAWRLVHDADRLATDLWPEQHIEAYAVVAKEELKAVGSMSANVLSETIAKTLDGPNHGKLKHLIKEARGLLFNARDNYYEELSDWQNKALWLVTVTTTIAMLLAAALPANSLFLLLGAAGGLLSRLSKTMSAKSIGFDYGVSWSVLFLAPLVGALTGWAGVLVSNLMVELKVLNPALITTPGAISQDTQMVLAVIFGFSARLFDGVMAGAEAALTKKPVSGDGNSQK